VLDAAATLDGKKSILIEHRQAQTTRARRYWLLPECDMSIARFVALDGERVTLQVDTDFALQNGMWNPTGWRAARFGTNHTALDSASLTVADISVNPIVPPADFDVVFPPGTEVFDRLLKQMYIVNPDGSKRIVSQAESERNAAYSQILNSPLGSAGRDPPFNGPRAWTVVVLGIVVATILIVVMRRQSALL